jgi:hypothetical protein
MGRIVISLSVILFSGAFPWPPAASHTHPWTFLGAKLLVVLDTESAMCSLAQSTRHVHRGIPDRRLRVSPQVSVGFCRIFDSAVGFVAGSE